MEPILKIDRLKTSFMTSNGEVQAVRGVSFSVHKGEILGIVGESGSGKSVTSMSILRLLADTARIKEGTIIFDGQDLTKLSKKAIRKIRGEKISMIFQDPMSSLNPLIPVGKQVLEMIKEHHPERTKEELKKEVLELFAKVRIPEPEKRIHAYPHEFSGGQRQRIGIARALILNPEFVVCDEAVSALDVSVRAQVLNLMKKMQKKRNLTYLFISHDLSVVRHVSDRVAVMYLGSVVEIAGKKELYSTPRHPYTQALLSAIPIPDANRKRNRIILEGDVPSAYNPPSGCKFHTRCPYARERCQTEVPKLRPADDRGHLVACHRDDLG